MKIGCQQFCIDPPFPVNRMLREEKHQAVTGHLYCRIIALYLENELPFYHVSIDTVELGRNVKTASHRRLRKQSGKGFIASARQHIPITVHV